MRFLFVLLLLTTSAFGFDCKVSDIWDEMQLTYIGGENTEKVLVSKKGEHWVLLIGKRKFSTRNSSDGKTRLVHQGFSDHHYFYYYENESRVWGLHIDVYPSGEVGGMIYSEGPIAGLSCITQ